MFWETIYVLSLTQNRNTMELHAHIYESKSGDLYLIRSLRIENRLQHWTGIKLKLHEDGHIIYQHGLSSNFVPPRVFIGVSKKDVLKQIQNEINQK